jgi:hypothetical protein
VNKTSLRNNAISSKRYPFTKDFVRGSLVAMRSRELLRMQLTKYSTCVMRVVFKYCRHDFGIGGWVREGKYERRSVGSRSPYCGMGVEVAKGSKGNR